PVPEMVITEPFAAALPGAFGDPSSFAATAWPDPLPSCAKIAGTAAATRRTISFVLRPLYSTVMRVVVFPATEYGTITRTASDCEASTFPGAPSNSTRVSPRSGPIALGSAVNGSDGPIVTPLLQIISPGATAPPRRLASFNVVETPMRAGSIRRS